MPDNSICLFASNALNGTNKLLIDLGNVLNPANFTLLHSYTTTADNHVLLNHSVCEDVCATDCRFLGIVNYSDWNVVLSSNACLKSGVENGLHPADPWLYQSFDGFGAYAAIHAGTFPAALTSTSTRTTSSSTSTTEDEPEAETTTYTSTTTTTLVKLIGAILYTWNGTTLADLTVADQTLLCSASNQHLINYTAVTEADIAGCFCRDTPSRRRSRRSTGNSVETVITINNATNVNITTVAADAISAPKMSVGGLAQLAVRASLVIPTTTTTTTTTQLHTTTATPIAERGPSENDPDIQFSDPVVYGSVIAAVVLIIGALIFKRSKNNSSSNMGENFLL